MPDQSLPTPPTPTFTDFQKLVDNLYAIAARIDDCKRLTSAMHQSASSSDISTPHEMNKCMEDVSKNLFTMLWEVSNEILSLAEAFKKRGEAES